MAYPQARQFHAVVVGLKIKTSLREGTSNPHDQLYRASMSICPNLAEGASAFTPGTKRRLERGVS
jgi:hypothetical protein